MKNKTSIRLLLLAIIVICSLALFSSARKISAANKECSENEKCSRKAQSEFIIWESFSRNLLSATN